jgi:hypothetical protein
MLREDDDETIPVGTSLAFPREDRASTVAGRSIRNIIHPFGPFAAPEFLPFRASPSALEVLLRTAEFTPEDFQSGVCPGAPLSMRFCRGRSGSM